MSREGAMAGIWCDITDDPTRESGDRPRRRLVAMRRALRRRCRRVFLPSRSRSLFLLLATVVRAVRKRARIPRVRPQSPRAWVRAMEKLTMSFRFNILAAACALGLPGAAFAQAATDLDEVIVTATRTAITVDDALAAVEVIDSEEIARSQARSLP